MRTSKTAWLLAITPVMLCSTTVYAPFISLRHKFLYHCNGSPSLVLAALLANLFAAYLALVFVLKVAERHRRFRVVFWSLFVASVPYLLVHDEALLMDRGAPAWLNRGILLLTLLSLAAEAVLWKRLVAGHFERFYAAAQSFTVVISLAWLATVGQLAYYAVATRGMNRPRPFHNGALATSSGTPDGRLLRGRPRVIWIILDELGYDQVFGRRLSGLQLPNLDQFAGQATTFTHAVAPGDFTEQVIPALLLGQPAQKVAFGIDGSLRYQNSEAQPWRAFAAGDTIFSDALAAGYTTALAGWHNPYCRLLAPVLDSCFWSARVDSATSEFDGQASFVTNLLGPARRIATLFHSRGQGTLNAAGDQFQARRHIEDVRTLVAETDRLIANPAADFLLVHIPAPHPAGIYNRQRRALTDSDAHVSYEDNLALADNILGHFRNELTALGEWDPSLVLVMGDHAWRTRLLWIGQRSWTPEDQLASHGGTFDPRPAYLVKLPMQQTAATIDESYPTLRTRALLQTVIRGNLRSPADLQAWVRGR